jgi:chromosome segregation ATPase
MAWPFSKSIKSSPKVRKMPKSPKAPKAKQTGSKPINLSGFNARLARLESGLHKIERNISTLDSDYDSIIKNIDSERKSFKKEIEPLFDAEAENKKIFKSLSATNKNIMTKINVVAGGMEKLAARQVTYEKAWNPAVLKKTVETITATNNALELIEKRDLKNVKTIEKVGHGLFAISNHARDIEAGHIDARAAARELSIKAKNLQETVDYFFKNTESLNNRINANSAGMADIVAALDMMKDKLAAVESQATQLTDMKDKLEQNMRSAEQLAQRIAYLEKATVKTIVLE